MIGDYRTDALREALGRAPREDDPLMALLILAFTGQNVSVTTGGVVVYYGHSRPARHAVALFDAEGNLAFETDRAMQIHLQRIVGAYVGSAHGAGQFYSRAVTEARDATAKSACDARDEDLDSPEGAVAAYEQVVGESWKPFERPVDNPGRTVSGRPPVGGSRLSHLGRGFGLAPFLDPASHGRSPHGASLSTVVISPGR